MTRRIESADGVRATVADEPSDEATGVGDALLFETLLGELSTTFVRITAGEIDREIERWLGRIVLALGFDRSTVGQVNPADGTLLATHSFAREGVEPLPERMDVATHLPWLAGKIFADEVVALSRVEDAPAEAEKDLEFAATMGNRSILALPLKIGGTVVGVVTFGAVRAEQPWPDRLIRRLRLVAEVFGNALERKRAVFEVRRFEEEMRQVSRVATMGELTVSLAHELNQPLGAILSNAQAARRMLGADEPNLEEVRAALEDIVRDNSRAVEIVSQVRALFQRGETQKSPLDLKQILLDIESLIRHDAMIRGIALRVEFPDSLPVVAGQRTQLMQVLLNLLLNAFDAVCENEGGKREVELRAGYDEAGHVLVAVRDSGRGIDPTIMPRLFTPFFTTKPKGIGLGLAIARSIVENHDGRLWAEQRPGRGAALLFELPATPMAATRG
jgi:signal transduction histidine kinase